MKKIEKSESEAKTEMTENKETEKTTTEEEVISAAQIIQWKKKWGRIFKTNIDGVIYIWRTLRRKEYVSIMGEKPAEGAENAMLYTRQDKIAETVVLYPEDFKDLMEANAGLATTISDECVFKSGFVNPESEEM